MTAVETVIFYINSAVNVHLMDTPKQNLPYTLLVQTMLRNID